MENGTFFPIPEERLREILAAVQEYSELPVRILRADGSPAAAFGPEGRCCAVLQRRAYRPGECRELHRRAGECACRQGEAYIFACRAGLYHISFPLVRGGEPLGSVLIGPFLMDTPDSAVVSALMEEFPLTPDTALELYEEFQGVRVVSPRRVTALSRLLEHLLAPLLPGERAALLRAREERSRREDEAPERENSGGDGTLYTREERMRACVRAGEGREAAALLEGLLSRCRNVEETRGRALQWVTLLSRAAMDGGAEPERMDLLSRRYLDLLRGERSAEGLRLLLQEALDGFVQASCAARDKGNPYVRKALRILAERYQQPLTAAAVATEVGLSANYFSSLFRRTTGESFSDRINRVRVGEGKRLLLATEEPVAQIAVAVGFSDQSYFSKVFRRYTGMSPARFRA